MKLIEPDYCPCCGKEFGCSKSAKCWCYEVETSPTLLQIISDNYNRCLCLDCLKKMNKKTKDKGLADWTK
jgi:hypothetical protein